MKALFNIAKFENETGIIELELKNGLWYWEWVSGYNNGLHSQEGFKNFEKAFNNMKKKSSSTIKEMKSDGLI